MAPPLTPSRVFVRIRPEAHEGGHDMSKDGVAKSLAGWGEASVTINTDYMFSKGSAEYKFPQQVLGPEVKQQDVFDSAGAELVEKFTARPGNNVMLLAYGQTGTGKTHTMFGPDSSLAANTPHPDWGLFPRVVDATLTRMQEGGGGGRWLLNASAVEFYFGEVNDLLNGGASCQIDEDRQPAGNVWVQMETVADLKPILDQITANRTTKSTKMNAASAEGTSGSSRSHCALMLNLMQLDKDSGLLSETTFTLLDLAGAERHSKSGADQDQSVMDAYMKVLYSGDNSGISDGTMIKVQGQIINYELFEVGKEVLLATTKHKKGQKYSPPRQNTTPTVTFLGQCLNGRAITAMMVCLSQAPSNGWETWFSLQYGTDLSKLRAPVKKVKAAKAEKQREAMKKEAAAAAKAAEKRPEPNEPAFKFFPKKLAYANYTKERLRLLNKLLDE